MDLENIAETTEALRACETEMASLYAEGKVNGPAHFSFGNEEQLIKIFREIQPGDWVCTTYRNHYHALLHGIPQEYLKQQIIGGRSMHIMSKEHRFITSALVSGTLPIAVGIALALQRQGSRNKVWAFCGDMAAQTGMFEECIKYAEQHTLPVTFIVEDNEYGCETPTQAVWGTSSPSQRKNIIYYTYKNKFPHQGADKMQVGF